MSTTQPLSELRKQGKRCIAAKEQHLLNLNQQMLTTLELQTTLRVAALSELEAQGYNVSLFDGRLASSHESRWTRIMLDTAFEEFADKEVKLSGRPRHFLTRPSGDP